MSDQEEQAWKAWVKDNGFRAINDANAISDWVRAAFLAGRRSVNGELVAALNGLLSAAEIGRIPPYMAQAVTDACRVLAALEPKEMTPNA